MKTFRRTVPTTTISIAMVEVDNGQPITTMLAPVIEVGEKLTSAEAQKKAIKKVMGEGYNIIVLGVEHTEKQYECTLDDFLAIAKPVEPKPEKV